MRRLRCPPVPAIAALLLFCLRVSAAWNSDAFGYKNNAPSPGREKVVRVGVLLPRADNHFVSIGKVQPAVDMAKLAVEQNKSLLTDYRISVQYRDTACSNLLGPINAFELKNVVDVFLGPACDYSCAPVAGYTAHWGIPLLTGGALSERFGRFKKTEYPLLTRTAPTLGSMADAYFGFIHAFGFERSFGIYDPDGQNNTLQKFCYFATDAINARNMAKNRDKDTLDFHMFRSMKDMDQVFRDKIGLNFAGKYITRFTRTCSCDGNVNKIVEYAM